MSFCCEIITHKWIDPAEVEFLPVNSALKLPIVNLKIIQRFSRTEFDVKKSGN